jgi:hypothetical protein
MAVTLTGMSVTAMASEWWLAPMALIGGWIALRLLLEIGESRTSLATMLVALACYGTAAAGALGWSPAVLGTWGDALTRALPLVGHTITLTSLLLFGRYVVLDVQGLIEHKPRPAAPVIKKKETESASKPAAALPAARPSAELKAVTPHAAPRHDNRWADDEGDDEQETTRKLSKAERKRLRKQNRAA